MKRFHVLHAIVTLLLITGVGVFAILTLTGLVEIRIPGGIWAKGNLQNQVNARSSADSTSVKAQLVVVRGAKPNAEYAIYEGRNVLGRADEKPVDIDLQIQESPQRIWSSRQHAVIICEDSNLVIEDLNSSNGAFVNRNRVPPGQKQTLTADDTIQIGEMQLKVVLR